MQCKDCTNALSDCDECDNNTSCVKCENNFYLDYNTHLCVSSCKNG